MWALLFAPVVAAGCVEKLGESYWYAEIGLSAITKGGDLYFWGDNEYFAASSDFELIPPLLTPSTALFPVEQQALSDVALFTGGDTHQCALLKNGSAACWGFDKEGSGKVGFGTTTPGTNYPTPVILPNVGPFADITAGDDTTCVISASDWTVWCIGDGSQHKAVDGSSLLKVATWTKVPFIANAAGIVAGGGTNYAWTTTGAVWAWGQNNHGQLTQNFNVDGYAPVSAVSGAVGCGAGADHVCCWTATMSLCWGLNDDGQVGINSYVPIINSPTPVLLPGNSALKIDGGDHHTCAINDKWTLYCWGLNNAGQLGLRDLNDRNKPSLPVLHNIVDVLADFESTCALTKGGDVLCWGGLSPLSTTFLSNGDAPATLEPVRFPDETFDCSEDGSQGKGKKDQGKKAKKAKVAAGLIGGVAGVAAIGMAIRYRRKRNYQALATSNAALPAV